MHRNLWLDIIYEVELYVQTYTIETFTFIQVRFLVAQKAKSQTTYLANYRFRFPTSHTQTLSPRLGS